MDSDPEPRSASPVTSLASAQGEDTPEEPPSPFQSAAFVLGPLIAVLTLALPFASVIADRSESPEPPRLSSRQGLASGASASTSPSPAPAPADRAPGLAPASAAGRPGL